MNTLKPAHLPHQLTVHMHEWHAMHDYRWLYMYQRQVT